MFAETLGRLADVPHAPPLVMCQEDHRFLVADLLREIGEDDGAILLEPAARNTAPAIAAAAVYVARNIGDCLLLVLPADHAIHETAEFVGAISEGIPYAEEGDLVTFGVVPTAPETGYGYIKATESTGGSRIEGFFEKPDVETAQGYLDDGGYYWNSGVFLFRASAILSSLRAHSPEVLEAAEGAVEGAQRDLDFFRLDRAAFTRAPAESIDCAVMERTGRGMVIPLDAGWNDIGSWSAAWQQRVTDGDADERGNAVHGDVVLHDSDDTLVHATHRLVAAVGVSGHVVVETADAVLVVPQERAQDVKQVVEELQATGRSESAFHRRVFRPWGSYEGIDFGPRYQVKRIVVNPGGRLSLQLHHHRAEHWVVVRGTAQVVRGESSFLLSEDESTYIPVGTVHRLENPGMIPLELIEVQSGSYLGEDDIVRLEDHYGRCLLAPVSSRQVPVES